MEHMGKVGISYFDVLSAEFTSATLRRFLTMAEGFPPDKRSSTASRIEVLPELFLPTKRLTRAKSVNLYDSNPRYLCRLRTFSISLIVGCYQHSTMIAHCYRSEIITRHGVLSPQASTARPDLPATPCRISMARTARKKALVRRQHRIVRIFWRVQGGINPIPNVSLEHSEIYETEQNNIMRCKVSFALVQNLVRRTCNQAPTHAPVLE